MLPDALRILMVAYASGELSPRRRRAAERLLKHSPEARALLTGLRDDAKLLRDLPVRCATADLERRILSRIPGANPANQPAFASSSRWPVVVSTMVAASVVLGVSLVAWSLMSIAKPLPSVESLTQSPREAIQPTEVTDVPSSPRETDRAMVVPSAPAVVVDSPSKSEPRVAPIPSETQPTTGGEFGAPTREAPELASVALSRMPEVFPVQSLADPAALERLIGELARADAHRVDLFCRDGSKGLERLQAALKQIGVRNLSDALIPEAQKRRWRGSYLVFTGDLNASEWGRVLQIVQKADRKAEEKKPGDGVMEQLVLMPLSPTDQRDLATMMGQDPIASVVPSIAHDPRRPVADDTAEQVVKSLAKSEAGKAARMAIAMLFPPGRTSFSHSNEVRQFLDSRRPHVPGTISVMLVVRTIG